MPKKHLKEAVKPQAPVKKVAKKAVAKETIKKAKVAAKSAPKSAPPAKPKKFAGADKSKSFVSMYRSEVAGGDPLTKTGEPVITSPVQKSEFPYVAVDPEQHTAIVLSRVENIYVIIPMSAEELKKVLMAKGIFESDDGYKPLNYDVRRAARKYLDHAKLAGITLDAERALCAITGDTPSRIVTESSDMPAKKKETATEAAPKAKGKAAKAEATPVKAKAKKEESSEGGRRGRPSPFAGKKIKVLSKETGARPGSKTDELRKIVLTSKTVEEAMGKKLADGDGVSVTTFRKMQSAGIIELV